MTDFVRQCGKSSIEFAAGGNVDYFYVAVYFILISLTSTVYFSQDGHKFYSGIGNDDR
ncbi:putative membrane protein [Propionispora sp. 2/2-37]|nr:putative membrane protein [Propionispora sp. 2/2-37]